jgi:drug/metabolite transporter (DMT)-like permease
MAVPTLITAILLIVVGVMGYANGTPGDDGKVSPTALIPAFVGAALAGCGLMAFNDKFRKHAMHLAAVVGLLGALGGFMPLVRQYNKTGALDPLKPSAAAGELMILICSIFLGLCVNSFIQAKKARKAAAMTNASPMPPQ